MEYQVTTVTKVSSVDTRTFVETKTFPSRRAAEKHAINQGGWGCLASMCLLWHDGKVIKAWGWEEQWTPFDVDPYDYEVYKKTWAVGECKQP